MMPQPVSRQLHSWGIQAQLHQIHTQEDSQQRYGAPPELEQPEQPEGKGAKILDPSLDPTRTVTASLSPHGALMREELTLGGFHTLLACGHNAPDAREERRHNQRCSKARETSEPEPGRRSPSPGAWLFD
ncbi:unnamed protein product [Rangifer tarandus platyrhynchus]|uniref:Uncharacterized protein n=1 Tax=Rangifer tarandus platyrhynchus TaxID=3082113 RepID=A0ABN8Y899_RANTA|nr:unnamed protein product [Rangifer tarandus platyrhynchus]